MLVYVLRQNGQPFMPTERFGKVRRLLKEGKAKVVRREPFTIKLLYEPETDVVQECYCGVDTGSILHRDNYTCQCCGKKNCRLEVHHIKFRRDGGTNDEENLITLCEDCHRGVHAGTVELNKKPKKSKNLKYATHMSVIRSQLLKKYPDTIETFGFVTSENRNHLQLEKDHYIDACVIASCGLEFKPLDVVFYKRRVSKGDYQLTKGIRGEQNLPTGKICGFRKFDKVKYLGEECFIKGKMSSGFAILMNIDGNKVDFSSMPKGLKTPKLSNCTRVLARRSCLCIKQIRRI